MTPTIQQQDSITVNTPKAKSWGFSNNALKYSFITTTDTFDESKECLGKIFYKIITKEPSTIITPHERNIYTTALQQLHREPSKNLSIDQFKNLSMNELKEAIVCIR